MKMNMRMMLGGDEVNHLDLDFIDGETNFQDQEPTDYHLINVTRDLQDAIADKSMALNLDLVAINPENFVSGFVDEFSYEFDEVLAFEKQICKFDEKLEFFVKESKDFFYFSIVYAIYYHLFEKKEDFVFFKTRKDCAKFYGEIFLKISSSKSTLCSST